MTPNSRAIQPASRPLTRVTTPFSLPLQPLPFSLPFFSRLLTLLCLHRGSLCLHRRLLCLHRGLLCLRRGLLCLHRGPLCLTPPAPPPPPVALPFSLASSGLLCLHRGWLCLHRELLKSFFTSDNDHLTTIFYVAAPVFSRTSPHWVCHRGL